MAQIRPTNWNQVFAADHKTEYKFVIGGVTYESGDIKGTPVITKPLLDVPAIGRCCTGSAKLTIYPKDTIPKAATVDAYCRLRSTEGNTVTDWVPQGKFYISTRGKKSPLEINCLDRMIKAGTTYLDKTAFTDWPQPMSAVVNEICQIMDVSLDARTEIKAGTGYTVDRPNEEVLISEILGMIGAAHGGNWIITESGKLRLVVLASPSGSIAQYLNRAHTGFSPRGEVQTITRITLEDAAGNQIVAGDDTGFTVSAKCYSATQAIANALCSASGLSIENGVTTIPDATVGNGQVSVTAGALVKGKLDLPTDSTLYGVRYEPYALDGAYLDPALELGDTVAVTARDGSEHLVVLQSIKMNCTVACTCAVSALINGETEDEYPYLTAQELSLTRTVRTDQTYYGNRINRSEGFVSELLVYGAPIARMTANASVFSMQAKEGGSWIDRIYFDNITGKYVITGDVTVQGLSTFINDLATAGSTIINGANITTGQIKSDNGNGFTIDLNAGTISVGGKNLYAALNTLDNDITISATAHMFTRASGANSYSPSSITLTAQSVNTLASYQWYKDNTALSGKTAQTLTITPSGINGTSATYKVVGTDSNGNTYTDMITVAKLADGSPGAQGDPGAAGQDSYTAILSNEFVEIPVDVNRKPLAAATYTCVVSIYKGLTALTATKSTPAAGQFQVSTGEAPFGINVAQNTAGTITLSVVKTKAITDSSELPLTITVYGGITVNAKITIHANMNNVTATQQATISTLSNQIALVVTETQSGDVINAASIVAAINDSGSSVIIDADKIDLNGYVTVTDLSTAGSTTINGANIITGTVTATQIDATDLRVNASNITGTLTIGQLPNTVAETSDIPTKVSELSNDSGYQTQNGVTTIIGNTVTTGFVNALGITAESLHSDDGTSFHRQVHVESGMIDFRYNGHIRAQMGIFGVTGALMLDADLGIQLGAGTGNAALYGSSLPSSNLYPGRLFFKI